MSEYKIEKGIKPPPSEKYPFKNMEIGDSFIFPSTKRTTVASSATLFVKRKQSTWKFRIRIDDKKKGFHRVWRVK